MSAFSDYLETALINATLRNSAYSSPATVYLALFTADPVDVGAAGEVSGGSYARQSIAFSAPSGGATANSGVVTFPVATTSWGTITHWGIFDAVSAGNLLYGGAWSASYVINTNDHFEVAAGNLTVTLQ